ncbi:hypothetical protein SEVIR_1G047600v4 [Setaria viridis]|uniref:Uncharacterized protein n=1 Tax=Setaria viridis TaxID=4556 RepID=A0A4U6W4X5_SETVI|nr:hypothetical protein SEVIR_1G047600v2 [Setaria viridis]
MDQAHYFTTVHGGGRRWRPPSWAPAPPATGTRRRRRRSCRSCRPRPPRSPSSSGSSRSWSESCFVADDDSLGRISSWLYASIIADLQLSCPSSFRQFSSAVSSSRSRWFCCQFIY